MATANDEFEDLMPHRIRVKGKPTKYDDYGKPINEVGEREYRCLIDDATTTMRNADGTEITVSVTAYVAPVPIDSQDGLPVDIEPDEEVNILSPRPQTRPIMSVERHYDSEEGVGELHNITLRFT